MERREFVRAALSIVVVLSGCTQDSPARQPLTKTELEADIAGRLKYHDVTLTDKGGGHFLGKGTDGDGQVHDLEVTQEERRLSWKTRYKGPDGESGGEGSISW